MRSVLAVRWFFLALLLLATGCYVFVMALGYQRTDKNLEAMERLRRLASVTIQAYPDHHPAEGLEFWKKLGRETPLADPWGGAYELERRKGGGRGDWQWRSAGPDRVMGSHDDLAVVVPYADSLPLDPTVQELAPTASEVEAR